MLPFPEGYYHFFHVSSQKKNNSVDLVVPAPPPYSRTHAAVPQTPNFGYKPLWSPNINSRCLADISRKGKRRPDQKSTVSTSAPRPETAANYITLNSSWSLPFELIHTETLLESKRDCIYPLGKIRHSPIRCASSSYEPFLQRGQTLG